MDQIWLVPKVQVFPLYAFGHESLFKYWKGMSWDTYDPFTLLCVIMQFKSQGGTFSWYL